MPQPLHATPFVVPPAQEALAIAALHALATARFAPEAELLATFAADGLRSELLDAWVAARLVHRGKVVLDPVVGTDANFLALTPTGARALATVSGRPASGISPAALSRAPATRAHEVLKGSAALAFLALERSGGVSLVGIQCDDKRLATSVAVQLGGRVERVALQADLLVAIRRPGGNPAALLIEVDRSTVSAPTRMAKRYAGYAAWKAANGPERDFGVRALRVLTLVPTERRLTRLLEVATAAVGPRNRMFLFALQRDVTALDPNGLRAPIARVLDSAGVPRVPLVD